MSIVKVTDVLRNHLQFLAKDTVSDAIGTVRMTRGIDVWTRLVQLTVNVKARGIHCSLMPALDNVSIFIHEDQV